MQTHLHLFTSNMCCRGFWSKTHMDTHFQIRLIAANCCRLLPTISLTVADLACTEWKSSFIRCSFLFFFCLFCFCFSQQHVICQHTSWTVKICDTDYRICAELLYFGYNFASQKFSILFLRDLWLRNPCYTRLRRISAYLQGT